MVRVCAVAICGAVLALALPAKADQLAFTEGLRIQGAYLTEVRQQGQQVRIEDWWTSAAPSVTALWWAPQRRISATYTLTGALHTFNNLNELNHLLTVASAYDLSKRTTLLVQAQATRTTVTNYLLTQGPAIGPTIGTGPTQTVTIFTPTYNKIVNASVNESLQHQLNPDYTLDQDLGVNLFSTLEPTPPLDTAAITGGGGIDRLWREDAVGVDAHATYTLRRSAPPLVESHFWTLTAGPHWRHDWSRDVSHNAGAGVNYIFSPDPGTKPVLGPNGHAGVVWTPGRFTVTGDVSYGVTPSALTGQLINAATASARGSVPISLHHHIVLSGGGSVGRSTIVDLNARLPDLKYDSYTIDGEVTYQVLPLVQIFARYLFVMQLADAAVAAFTPSFLRDQFLVGVQLTTRPPVGERAGAGGGKKEEEGLEVETGFPKRVDGADRRGGLPADTPADIEERNNKYPNQPETNQDTGTPFFTGVLPPPQPPNVPVGQEKPAREKKPAKDDD